MTGTAELWRRLDRPFDSAHALEALVGMPHATARYLVSVRLATSRETDGLLDRMHEIVRSLAIATTLSPVRTSGDIRGPVLWSETVAARSASPGANGVFVCASPSKAYDTDENKVLVHALAKIRDTARGFEGATIVASDDPSLRRARHNVVKAIRFLEHRTLVGVPRERPNGRAIQKARQGSKARTYRLAVNMLERAADPVDADEAAELGDPYTDRQHRLVIDLADALVLTHLRIDRSTFRAGPVHYIHRQRQDRDGLHGVLLDDVLLDVVPDGVSADDAERDLASRAAGRPFLLVRTGDDVGRALRLAGH
jgi:hypothetical protein